MAFPKAMSHDGQNEQFETTESLKEKLKGAGYTVIETNLSDSPYIQTTVAKRVDK